MRVVRKSSLPSVRLNGEIAAYIFDGAAHGGVGSSAFVVDVAPGTGPRRHTHPYGEVFIVLDGLVRLEAGGEFVDATPEEICVVPAGVPHTFTNIGPVRARMVNLHAAGTVVTEFVEDLRADAGVTYEYDHTT